MKNGDEPIEQVLLQLHEERLDYFIRESNLIEGITVSKGHPLYDNHRAAVELVLDAAEKNKWVRPIDIHACLMARSEDLRPEDIGRYRSVQVTVGNCIPPKPMIVPNLMVAWSSQVQKFLKTEGDIYETELAQKCFAFHKWFECIHPFVDGNGRVGRLIWLHLWRRCGLPWVTFLRHAYYDSIQTWRSREWDRLKNESLSGELNA